MVKMVVSVRRAGLQHGVEAVEILQHGGEDQKSHHDFDARQPFAGARQLPQITGEQSQQEERQGQACGENDHAEHRAQLFAADRSREQCSHEWTDAGERGQREGEAHQERADDSALSRGGVEFGEQTGGDGDFEGSQ